MFHDLTLIAACAVLAYIAFTDLTSATIPNLSVVLLFIAGVGAATADPVWHLGAAAVTFACTFFLWQTDNLGGGDVKMLTMIALCLGAMFPWFLVAFGFAAALIGVTRTLVLPRIWQRRERQNLIPMGAAAFPAFCVVVVAMQGVV